jgi:UDP-N-acetylglucosamine--N-acetylmuramyl-(pentapeptide) pyrophosphoryl-undecaprenol N-acetylglucosamine transferase
LLECTASREEARLKLGLKPDVRTILVVGGSLGARTINLSLIGGLERIAQAPVQLLWQSGKYYDEQCREAVQRAAIANVKQVPFIAEMDMAYRAADLVVSRAGASSISELQLLGKAAILVPSPNVAEDHQTKNALALVDRNAAIMVRDADAPTRLVDTMLRTVADEGVIETLEHNVLAMALPGSDEAIVNQVERIVAEKKR